MLDDNDISKLIIGIETTIGKKLDDKFKTFEENFELKIEKKVTTWTKKTIQETLEAIGFEMEKPLEIQKDMAFVRWQRKLCTNAFTKVFVTISGFWIIGAIIEYLRSKGFSISK